MPPQHTSSETCAISILDLPKGSSLTLDGQTILLQRDDFVGIKGIPINSDFHFVVTRAAACGSKEEQKQGNVAAVSVGFVFETHSGHPLSLVRRFDASTEEVSSIEVDGTTATNLCNRIRDIQMEPQRLISYGDIFPTERALEWKNLTNYVSHQLLKDRGTQNGSKIIPGSYDDDGETTTYSTKEMQVDSQHSHCDEDGSSVSYPPIPVLDSRKSARHSRHVGTRRYLASLSPSDRTALFLHSSPHNFLFESILGHTYRNRWTDILGDVQLSYIIFLHLQCLSSLEHW